MWCVAVVLLIVSISFVGLALCLIIIFVGIGCARRSTTCWQLILSPIHTADADATVELSRVGVGGVYGALLSLTRIARTVLSKDVCPSVQRFVCHTPVLCKTAKYRPAGDRNFFTVAFWNSDGVMCCFKFKGASNIQKYNSIAKYSKMVNGSLIL